MNAEGVLATDVAGVNGAVLVKYGVDSRTQRKHMRHL
jgi:hypothetical protein